jgi:hypothetical protein
VGRRRPTTGAPSTSASWASSRATRAELHGITGFEEVETSAGGRAVRAGSATPPRRATPWCCPSTSSCRPGRAACSATAAARWWPSTRATARCWPSSASPPSTPTCSSTASTPRAGARSTSRIDKPLLNRALRGTYPPGSTFKPFMAMAALNRQAQPQAPSTTAAPSSSATTPSAATATTAWAGGHAPLHRQEQQRLLLLAGQRDGRGPDARAAQPFGLGARPASTWKGEVTGVLPSTDWKRGLQEARAAEVVRRRDHLAGHRPGLQQLHHAAAGQRHRHAGVGRPALRAAAGARDRGRRHPPAPRRWRARRWRRCPSSPSMWPW